MKSTSEATDVSAEVLMGQVVEEYLDRLNRGERPEVESYARRYPQLAGVLRQMLPALELMRAPGENLSGQDEFSAPPSLLAGCLGDYRILREVGRGGMGVVYEAEQISLGRRVALKVLPFASTLDAKQLQRFKNEAHAAAQLHHTHIVPVYATGCERGVHFYAMQYVEGQTLAQVIADLRLQIADVNNPVGLQSGEDSPTGPYAPQSLTCDRQSATTLTPPVASLSTQRSTHGPKFFRSVAELGIQAAEALEHAHQLGIIHRDIKPANLLMEQSPATAYHSPLTTHHSPLRLWVTDFGLAHVQSQAGLTLTGDLVGTLRYMSPEQALAKRVPIDHRTDIYSLGVTLFELLTLEPAFGGRDRQELLRQIAFEEPRPPRRLNRAIPRELETIVGKAMEKNPADRYAAAQELADDLARFLKDEPIRARRPTLVQRARKWARRHKAAVWAAAVCLSVTLLVLAVSIGRAARDRAAQRATTAAQVTLVLNEAAVLQGQHKWREALGAVKRAEALLASGGDAALHNRAQGLRRDLEMAARVDHLRIQKTLFDPTGFYVGKAPAGTTYARAFEAYGIDVLADAPQGVADSIQARSIRKQLVAALDDWILVERDAGVRKRLWVIAELTDPTPDKWRKNLRQVVAAKDRRVLEKLAARPEVAGLPPATANLLGQALSDAGGGARTVQLLKAVQQRHPQEFWLNFQLGIQFLWGPGVQHNPGAAAGYLRAALAVRPDFPTVYTYLALALPGPQHLDEVIALNRKAIELNPTYAAAHNNLGAALLGKGLLDEAIAEYREAIRLNKDDPRGHSNLGAALAQKGLLDEAIAEYREAIRLNKDNPVPRFNLGGVLCLKGRLDEAITECRQAIRLKKDCCEAHSDLGYALRLKGRLDEAIAECREAVRLNKDYAGGHVNLGAALLGKGRLDEAIAELHEAIRLKKDCSEAHQNLGAALLGKGLLDQAIAEGRKAVRFKKDSPDAHYNLGTALGHKGRLDEAIAEFRQTIRLKKDHPEAHNNLGGALADKDRTDEAIAEYHEALRFKEDFPEAHYNLGNALGRKGRLDEAITEYREAIRLKNDYPGAHNNLGNALRLKGLLDEAIAEFREVVRQKKDSPEAHNNLGAALAGKGRLDEAIVEFREVLRLKKDDALAQVNLGYALLQKGQFRQAAAELRRGHELGSRNPRWSYRSAELLRRAERLAELDDRLTAVQEGKEQPKDTGERLALAQLCQVYKKRFAAAAQFYKQAFAAEPKLAEDLKMGHRYNAACAAALAGCGQGKDAAQFGDKECARLRRLALDWLRADLEAWGKVLQKEPDNARPIVVQQMRHWLADADLAGVRVDHTLAKMPEPERPAWQKFWAAARDTLARAQGKKPLDEKSKPK
jgi:tetratricopeptide (TPR) repeat protein